MLPIAALDDGRFHWSHVPLWLTAVGYILFLVGMGLSARARIVNQFAEPFVRIQTECGHTRKLAALQQQRNSILTEEQEKSGYEARMAAMAADKTGKDLQKAVDDAMKVTPEQKSKLEPIIEAG